MLDQLPLFLPESSWTPPNINDLPTNWNLTDRVAVDIEGFDPNLKTTGPSIRTGGYMVGIGFALEGGPKHYLPFAHQGGDNLDKEQVYNYLDYQFRRFTGHVVGANLSYDLDYLWADGFDFPNVAGYKDVLIAEPLINDLAFSYSLNSVAEKYLGEQKSKTLMEEAARIYGMGAKGSPKGKGQNNVGAWIWKLPARFVGLYGEDDCDLPLRVLRHQEAIIKSQGLERVWETESRLLPILTKMRAKGVRVDESRLMEIDARCYRERREASEAITRLTGVAIGPDDAMQKELIVKALGNAGFNGLTAKSSIDAVFLRENADDAVVRELARLRKWDTLRKLSIEPVKNHLVNGRIHCTFSQLAAEREDGNGVKGARFGRLSCSHVNMQQQPARDEDIGAIWRNIYLPDQGKLWASNDYSQQEPKILIHWAETIQRLRDYDWPMVGADKVAQRFRDDPNADNHQMMADIAGVPRKAAKTLFLGLCYGMGVTTMCRQLGLEVIHQRIEDGPRMGATRIVAGAEGQELLRRFHNSVPFLREMVKLCTSRAHSNGYIKTLLGRRCRFPKADDGVNHLWTERALNRLVQGSAADQTKLAVVAAAEAGFDLRLQVHDEICLNVETAGEAKEAAHIMENVVPMRVPSKVDVEIGPSWGEAA